MGSNATVGQQQRTQRDKRCDGDDLHHGEPEFEAAVFAYVDQVNEQQGKGKSGNPDNPRNRWEPQPHVDARGNQFRADRDRNSRPISTTREKSCPVVEVEVSVHAERSGSGMSTGQLSDGAGDRKVDERSQKVTKNDCRPGQSDGAGRPKQEASADRAANGDHGNLSGAQLVTKSLFFVGVARVGHQETYTRKGSYVPKFKARMTFVTAASRYRIAAVYPCS
ncbi:MAG TPA: hypothetical protein VLL05_14845 [Terriglobales bacterium]|nr:hypothetical protein [Terriglobales bacterium]